MRHTLTAILWGEPLATYAPLDKPPIVCHED